MAPPLALSVLSEVEDLIDRFGAYAGFASVLGLALLTLLYIGQARELKRLREWAGQMPERGGDLQGRITPNEPSRVTPVPAPRPRPAQPATAAGQAAASQTVAAAAITRATAAATPSPATPEEPPAEKEAESDAKTTPESPLVPGKTGSDGAKVADLGETVVQEPARPVNPLDRARQPQTARAAGLPPTPGEKRQRGPLIAAAAAVTALVALAVYFLAFSGDDGKTPTRDSEPQAVTETTTARTTQTTRATPNSDISVFVLNGTTVNGLARGLANKLEQEGYTIKGTDTASDQTRAATLVMYANGKRSQALRVARSIGKGADVVEAIDPGAAALSQGASVVIVVGADQNVTNPG